MAKSKEIRTCLRLKLSQADSQTQMRPVASCPSTKVLSSLRCCKQTDLSGDSWFSPTPCTRALEREFALHKKDYPRSKGQLVRDQWEWWVPWSSTNLRADKFTSLGVNANCLMTILAREATWLQIKAWAKIKLTTVFCLILWFKSAMQVTMALSQSNSTNSQPSKKKS